MNHVDRSDDVVVFVHTSFRSDTEDGSSRNSSSIRIQIDLRRDGETGKRLLLLGDLEYEQIEAFVAKTEAAGNEDYLWWDLLLAPHHCSQNAIRRKDGDEWVGAQAAEDLGRYAADDAMVVVSARSIDDISDDDTDPPHTDARGVYERLVGADAVVYTSDYADGSDSDPLVATWLDDGTIEVGESKAQ